MKWRRNFRLNVAVRIASLLLTALGLGFIAFRELNPAWGAVLGVGFVATSWNLIRYVERSQRETELFLLNLRYRDYTSFPVQADRGKRHAALQRIFNQIIGDFRQLRAEKESHYRYLQQVVGHLRTALICYSDGGKILLMNQAARQLLERPYLHQLDALGRTHPELYELLESLKHGERQVIRLSRGEEILQVAVEASGFRLQDETYRLVSLQNIQEELESQEIEAWQKLIRVLTHETMNSITPIISLAEALGKSLPDPGDTAGRLSDEEIEDLRQGLSTIHQRSRGMLHFVRAYRSITRSPEPTFTRVDLGKLLEETAALFAPDFEAQSIQLNLDLPETSIELRADPSLLQQVLINLLKNALDAVTGQSDARIWLQAERVDQYPLVRVRDNGPGIPEEFQQQVFVPFFSSKEKGTGIGLSLSRRIARVHGGSLFFRSEPGRGTEFVMRLPREEQPAEMAGKSTY